MQAGQVPAAPARAIPGYENRPVRSLTLQLNPADLGTVTLTVKLRQQDIELRLETESESTLRLLRRDELVLHEVLRCAGYDSDAASLQIVLKPAAGAMPVASSPSPSSHSPAGSPQQPLSAFDSQPGSAHSGHRQENHRSQPFQSGKLNHDDGTPVPGTRTISGVFV
jgi:chemotaxis protein MotD